MYNEKTSTVSTIVPMVEGGEDSVRSDYSELVKVAASEIWRDATTRTNVEAQDAQPTFGYEELLANLADPSLLDSRADG